MEKILLFFCVLCVVTGSKFSRLNGDWDVEEFYEMDGDKNKIEDNFMGELLGNSQQHFASFTFSAEYLCESCLNIFLLFFSISASLW